MAPATCSVVVANDASNSAPRGVEGIVNQRVAEKITSRDPDPFSYSRASIIELARTNAWHYVETLSYGGQEDVATPDTRRAIKLATHIVDEKFYELFPVKAETSL